MGRTKVRFEGRPVAGGGSVGAGGPPVRGTARRGGSTHVNEAGGARRRLGRATAAARVVAIGPAGRAAACTGRVRIDGAA